MNEYYKDWIFFIIGWTIIILSAYLIYDYINKDNSNSNIVFNEDNKISQKKLTNEIIKNEYNNTITIKNNITYVKNMRIK